MKNKDNKKTRNKKIDKIIYVSAMIALYIALNYLKNKYGYILNESDTYVENESDDFNNIDELKLEVQFIDVGQADSILIRANGEAMLIDAGNNEDGEKLVKYFKELGIKEFEYVVGTHAHEDHIGGMDDIIDNFDIDKFYMPDAVATTKTFEDVLDSLEKKDYYLDVPEIGEEFNLGDAKLRVLYVDEYTGNYNDTSIVLRMDYGEISYLFTGDATTKVEKQMLNNNENLDVDVLKVGHHGSDTSTSKKFIEATTPDYAIIEVGENNIYNLPKEKIIERIMNQGIEIFRTDYDGTIISETDGKVLTFRKEKTDTNGR